MSQGNVDRLRESYRLLNTRFAEFKAGDFGPLLDAFYDPGVVIEMVGAPDADSYEGHDGVRRWFNDAYSAWESIQIEEEDFIQSGEWTVAQIRASVRGAGSGVELAFLSTTVFQFRDGLIVRQSTYVDRAEALKAAGLEG